jgi:lysR protein
MTGLVRITVPSWRINDSVLSQLLTALAPYPELITDWRDDMSKLDAVTHRVDIGLRIGLQPDENLLLKKSPILAMY